MTRITAHVIFNLKSEEDDPLYWSNTMGWVSLSDATQFTIDEHKTLHLPIDGIWQALLLSSKA
jgi:hypothetical protein